MMPLHGVSARAPEEPASLRGQINRHRDAIVACVPGPVIALSVDWNADGSFGVVVRDRPGSREEACVRAVLAGERIDPAPGSSGTLLHVIEGDPHMRTLPDEEPGP